MSEMILLRKEIEKAEFDKVKLTLSNISKVLRRKLMVFSAKIDGRNNTGQISTYNRGGELNAGTV